MRYWLRQLPGGLCTRAAVIASALRKPTSVFTKAEIPSYAPQIMERTGPARQSRRKLFTLSEVSANMLSQRQRGVLSQFECCARLTFCSYLKHSVCHSGPLPLPLALSGGPPSGARLPRSIVLRRLRALILSTQSAAVLTSHQCSFIRRRGPASRTLLPAAIILPSTLKKKSETNLPRQNPPSRSPFC